MVGPGRQVRQRLRAVVYTFAAPLARIAASRSHWTDMQQLDFELEPDRDFIELNQLLKLVGLCDSGGAGKAIVAGGAVSVDGQPELRKTCKIRAGQRVRVGDVAIQVAAAG
jgi:ribosome-associated protein